MGDTRGFLEFDGMVFQDPMDPCGVEHALRYGEPTREQLLQAASFIVSYRQLIYDPQQVRNQNISKIRRLAIRPTTPEVQDD